jgi:hypothetical protein
VVLLLYAAQSAHLGAFAGAVGLGFVIGVVGHLTRSRALVIAGIFLIAAASAYFSFVLQPSGQ